MLPDRVLRRVQPSGECWQWGGARQPNGYGYTRWRVDGEWKNVRVHRLFYEEHVGPIPAGLEIDHTCKNRACVNPLHLRAVTHAENLETRNHRGKAKKDACQAGHPYTDETVYIGSKGERCCILCRREYKRQWRADRRAKGLPAG